MHADGMVTYADEECLVPIDISASLPINRLSNVVQACIDLHLCDVSTQSHYVS